MAHRFRDYTASGDADPARARTAAVVDLAIGCLAGIIAWPFPVARMMLQDATGSAALGWAVHVPLLLVFMLIASWATAGITIATAHRTVGMYFQDIGLAALPSRTRDSLTFACAWTLAAVPAVFGAAGPMARLASTRLHSTR